MSKDTTDSGGLAPRAGREAFAVEFLSRTSGKLLYGTIILAAVLGSLNDPLPRGARVIVISVISLYAISLADAYARLINDDIKRRRVTPFGETWSRILRPGWVMGSAVVPVVFFSLSTVGVIRPAMAFRGTTIGLVAIVMIVSYLARRVSGAGVAVALVYSTSAAAVAYTLVWLKLWSKHLPVIIQ